MRSTVEIIVAVKESQPVTEEELRLAILALSSIEHFVEEELRTLIEAVEVNNPSAKLRAELARGTLIRMFQARKKSPAEWLGPNNIPGNPEHDKRLAMAKLMFKQATGEDL